MCFEYIKHINCTCFAKVLQDMGEVPHAATLIAAHLDYISFTLQARSHQLRQELQLVRFHHRHGRLMFTEIDLIINAVLLENIYLDGWFVMQSRRVI